MSARLTRREVGGINAALGLALAGEEEPAWGRGAHKAMESAQDKLHAAGADVWLAVSPGEAKAGLEAISQMTDGNARSFDEWRQQTHGTHAQWKALLRLEAKLRNVVEG